MSKPSSKQTNETKSLPKMNLGVELPEFDKAKYPHGGYGKLRDFGWRILDQIEYVKPDKHSRLIRFENLQGMLDDEEAKKLHRPKNNEGHLLEHLDGTLYFIVGYRDGEIRLGVLGDDVTTCYDIYLEEGLFAFDVREYDYDCSEMWMGEFEKPYVQLQAKHLETNGMLHSEDFLSIAIFRDDVVEPLADNFLELMYGHKWDYPLNEIRQVSNVIFHYSRMTAKGIVETEREGFEAVVSECCSTEGLVTLWNDFNHAADFLFGKANANSLLELLPPKELSELCARWIKVPEGANLYNPFAGIGDIAHILPDVNVVGEEKDILLLQVAAERCEKPSSWVEYGDSMQSLADSSKKYDFITFIPPLSLAADAIGMALEKLNHEGEMVCILPLAFTSSRQYEKLRKKILSECHSIDVVSLPALYSPHTSAELCLLHVTKGQSGYDLIHLMDGSSFSHSNEYSPRKILKVSSLIESCKLGTRDIVAISREQLVGNDLTPSRYLICLPELTTEFKYLPLIDLVSVIQSEHSSDSVSTYVSMTELTSSIISPVIPVAKRNTKSVSKITESSILISTSGTLRFGKIQDVPSYISDSIIAVKANDSLILDDYLLIELQSDYVQQQFKALSTGTALKRVSRRDLLNIQIAVPSKEKQQAIVTEALKGSLVESEAKLRQQFECYRKEIRVRKHAIVQNLSALDSQWNTLNSFRLRNGGNLNANDMIGRINPRPVGMFFDTIDTYLDTLKNQTHHLSEVEYDWGEPSLIEPLVFLRKYIDTHSDDRYTCELKGDDSQKMRILIPSRALRQVIDNIVANALSHGFSKPDFKGYRIHFSAFAEEDKVIILVANNGTAMTLQPDMVFAYGASSALNREYASANGTKAIHSGIGGHDMKEILQSYGASVTIKSINPDDNDGYTVVYRIEFNNNIIF